MYVYVQPTAASVDLLSNEALLTLLDLHNASPFLLFPS
jgi:hypothetical protein